MVVLVAELCVWVDVDTLFTIEVCISTLTVVIVVVLVALGKTVETLVLKEVTVTVPVGAVTVVTFVDVTVVQRPLEA